MKPGPLATILWGQWNKSRLALAGLVLALLCGALTLAVMDRYGLRPNAGKTSDDFVVSVLFISLAALVSMVTLLLIHSDSETLHVSLPIRMLRLPVPTWKLVAALLGYGAAVMGVVTLVATLIVKTVIHTDFSWWLPLCLAIPAAAALQTWALACGNTNPKSAILLLAAMVGAGLWIARQEAAFTIIGRTHPVIVLLALSGPLGLFYLLALAGVAVNRHGGLPDWPASLMFERRSVLAAKPFRSPLHAQLWYEWRRFGWQLPLVVVAVLALYFLGMPLVVAVFKGSNVTGNSSSEGFSALFFVDWITSAQFVTTGLQTSGAVAGVLVGGYLFMKAGYWNSLSTHLMTRPLSTRALAWARLRMVLVSTLLSLAILMAGLGLAVLVLKATGQSLGIIENIEQGYERFPDAAILAFFWGIIFILMWSAVWSVNVGWLLLVFGAAFLPTLLVTAILEAAGALPLAGAPALVWEVCTWTSAAVLVAAALWACLRSSRRGLAGPRAKWVALFCWALYSSAFVTYGLSLDLPFDANIPNPFPHPIDWGLWLSLSVLPIAPIFTHPILLERARHR